MPGVLHNLILSSNIDAPHGIYFSTPMPATSNFDISERGVAFVGQDLSKKSPLQSENSYPYFVGIDSYTLPPAKEPLSITVPPDLEGSTSCIRQSPDASTIGFLFSREGGDLEDRHLYLCSSSTLKAFNFFQIISQTVPSDDYNPPTEFEFAGDSFSCIFQSDYCGRVILSHMKLCEETESRTIFGDGSVSGFHPLIAGDWSRLLVSSSTYIDNSIWQIVDVSEAKVARTISSATRTGAKLGLHPSMVSEFWFEGSDNVCMHAFLVRPSEFDENKKYPWILSPHGGPEGAWTDGWKQQVSSPEPNPVAI